MLDIIAGLGTFELSSGHSISAREAAIQVLRDAGVPLHAVEITGRILERRLWETSGKTPAATIEAQICKDMQKKGAASPFIRTAPRTFALRSPEPPPPGGRTKPQTAVSDTSGLSFTDAAERVLNDFGQKSPMHYREITAKALQNAWISPSGKTPQASMYTQLISEIRRHKNRGSIPRFVQHGQGYFGLSRWMGRGLALRSRWREIRRML